MRESDRSRTQTSGQLTPPPRPPRVTTGTISPFPPEPPVSPRMKWTPMSPLRMVLEMVVRPIVEPIVRGLRGALHP